MTWNLDQILNYTVFTFFSVVLFCLILLTPVDAIYQCFITQRLTNIFIITGAYVVTFVLAVLIYATRIYTNRSALSGIPKAWIPVEKEDVSKSVRRLVVEGLARSAIVAYQARPRDPSITTADDDADSFADYPMLLVDRNQPPWGEIEHPGWSSPQSPDLPDRPYNTVVQELPNLVEAKAVSLAPFLANTAPFDPSSSYPDSGNKHYNYNNEGHSVPDTRVVDILRRPASMGLREYLQHLTRLNVIPRPEAGAEFLALYERARFSSHPLREEDFRDLMHVFAELLRGMRSLDSNALGEIHGAGSFTESESVIGPSDEEVDTDVMDFPYPDSSPYRYDVDDIDDREALSRGRSNSNSLRPSSHASASTWEGGGGRSVYATPPRQRGDFDRYPHRMMLAPRTPSMRSLRPVASNVSGSSGGSVIRFTETRDPSDLPYTIDLSGNSVGSGRRYQ